MVTTHTALQHRNQPIIQTMESLSNNPKLLLVRMIRREKTHSNLSNQVNKRKEGLEIYHLDRLYQLIHYYSLDLQTNLIRSSQSYS